ncbi:unnamed protein product [Effrenium voratum]|nr:unnamed protein product [Effrenium voratum]
MGAGFRRRSALPGASSSPPSATPCSASASRRRNHIDLRGGRWPQAFREAGSSGDMAVVGSSVGAIPLLGQEFARNGYFNIALHASFGGIFMPLAVWTAVRTPGVHHQAVLERVLGLRGQGPQNLGAIYFHAFFFGGGGYTVYGYPLEGFYHTPCIGFPKPQASGLLRKAKWGVVLAVHSAAILMQAIGTQMHFFLDGGGLLFEGPNCIHSDVPSPLTLVLGILQSFAQAPRYQGPAGPSSCATVIGDPDAGHLDRACAYRGVSCPEAKGTALQSGLLASWLFMERQWPSWPQTCLEFPVALLIFFTVLGVWASRASLAPLAFGPSVFLVAEPRPGTREIFGSAIRLEHGNPKMTEVDSLSGNSKAGLAHHGAEEAKASVQMYVAVGVAMVGAAMFGFDQGNFGNVQAFESFRNEWCLKNYGDVFSCSEEGSLDNDRWNDDFVTWGATLITFGAAAGAIIAGPPLTNKLGRRPCIQIGGFVCFIGCLMASYFSFHSVPEFFVGRFITGAGVGISCFALPLYNAEISTPGIRGATGSLFQLNVVVGCFISCLITFFDKDWYMGMLLPGLAGAVLVVGGFFIPESPRFVMEKMMHKDHNVEKALAAGTKYAGIRKGDVSAEANEIMDQIKEEMNIEHVSFIGLFKERNLRKRTFIACTLVICQQTTGVNAFLGYAATLFKQCGINDPIQFNAIFNSIMIFGCVAGLLLVDSKYGGRRCQLLVATVMMGPPLLLAGLALQFDWAGLITMTCVIIYGVGFQFAWGTIPWIYPAEIFSMAEKESAVSLAVGFNYIANAVIIYITPTLMKWSTPGTLLVFAVLNILNAFFVFAYIKETKGVPLEQIPDLFRRKKYDEEGSTTDGGSSSEGF